MQINAGSFVLCSRRFCSPASSVSRRRLQAHSAVRVNDCPRVPIGLSRSRLAPIEGVTVTCWKKEGDEFRAAMRERDRSNVGRMARLPGAVETASSPPAWPGILPSDWKVKSHVAGVAASTLPALYGYFQLYHNKEFCDNRGASSVARSLVEELDIFHLSY
jgi:hypothetical protein